MRLVYQTLTSVTITTTAILGGLSAIAQAASFSGGQNFTNIGFQKDALISKVGFDLASLYTNETTLPQTNSSLQVYDNHVVINAVATGSTDNLLVDLQGLGLQRASKFGSFVSGLLPITNINKMADLKNLQFARAAYKPSANVGLITSQADRAMKADQARTLFNVDGTGVTVGVLSDSFDNLGGAKNDIVTGDLPAKINVLKDLPSGGNDEGRAMMQLIHDVAPGANLAFHTAFIGQADFANGILKLANEGKANVIVDDIYYEEAPMFQDGIIAQAVDTVVANGVSYFSSAGNYGRNAYESAFNSSGIRDSQTGGELHDFDPGEKVDTFQSITVPIGSGFRISFQWDSPFFSVSPQTGGSPNDLDILLYDDSATNLLAFSRENNLSKDALEIFEFINDGSYGTDKFNLAISNITGPNPGLMKYVLFGFGGTINEFNTASSTLYGHANAQGAEAVGAAFYANTPAFGTDPAVLEPFSSAGSTLILFDTNGDRLASPEIRQKPEIVAPDGTNTTFFIPGFDPENDGFPNFIGTSAAAPNAAAVAALMLQAAPGTSPNKIYSILENTALDMKTPGFDFDSGFGLIQADRAVGTIINSPVKPVPEPRFILSLLLFSLMSAVSVQKRQSNFKNFIAKK